MKHHPLRLLLLTVTGVCAACAAERAEDIEKRIGRLTVEVGETPGNYAALMRLGRDHAALGHTDLAESAYARAIKAEPESVEPYHALALLYLAGARYADARKACAAWRKLDPESYYAALCLADAYSLDGDFKNSAKVLTQLSRRHPSDVAVLGALKLRLDWLGDKSGAEAVARRIEVINRLAKGA